MEITGFSEGVFPMKYLGVPLQPNKWNKAICNSLVERITSRVHSWANRKLSYAGRLQLINAVMSSMLVYWAGTFILPTSMLEYVQKICRRFLWSGNELSKKKIALVNWEKVCLPKNKGGVNIKDCFIWNVAAISKQIWYIAAKKDIMWVRWVNIIYMKHKPFWDYNVSPDASWYWRKLNALKLKIKEWIHDDGKWKLTATGVFTISSCYNALQGSREKSKQAKWIWGKFHVPKHSFILWICAQSRLLTMDKLLKFGIDVINPNCCVCSNTGEDHAHLFFKCPWSMCLLDHLKRWLQITSMSASLEGILRWLDRAQMKQIRKLFLASVVAAAVYYVWWARNQKVFNGTNIEVQKIIDRIKSEMQIRLSYVVSKMKFIPRQLSMYLV